MPSNRSAPGELLGSLVAVGLQCAGDCSPEVRRRSKRTSPCYLCVGGDWAAAGCVSAAGAHGHSLLAQYPLELALNGSSENHQTAINEPLLVVILGPTASGKTALSMAVAEKFQGEIVNCDSVAMYREFDIGTAKPSHAERAEIPHHLLDCIDPLQDISAGEYARQARKAICEISARGRLPIVSGGTVLYLRAL